MGNRKPRIQRRLEPLRLRTHLPPRAPLPAARLAADLLSPDHRTALPGALPPSRHPPRARRRRPAPPLVTELSNVHARRRGLQLRTRRMRSLPFRFSVFLRLAQFFVDVSVHREKTGEENRRRLAAQPRSPAQGTSSHVPTVHGSGIPKPLGCVRPLLTPEIWDKFWKLQTGAFLSEVPIRGGRKVQ